MCKERIILAPKDFYRLPDFRDLSRSALYRRYNQVRDFAGKRKDQPVTVLDLAEWLNIEPAQIRELIFSQ